MAKFERERFNNEVLKSYRNIFARIVNAFDDVTINNLCFTEACRKHKIDYMSVRRLMDLQIFKSIDITDTMLSSELLSIDSKLLKKDPYILFYQNALGVSDTTISITNFPMDIEETIDYIISTFPDKTQIILKELHGFNDEYEPKTLNQVGEIVGMTKEGVRLINKKAMMKVRRNYSLYLRKGKHTAELEIAKMEEYARQALEIKQQHKRESLALLRHELSYTTPDDIKSIPIENIELTIRSYNALKKAGINNVGDMIKLNSHDLYNIRNLGVKSVNEILNTIHRFTGDVNQAAI